MYVQSLRVKQVKRVVIDSIDNYTYVMYVYRPRVKQAKRVVIDFADNYTYMYVYRPRVKQVNKTSLEVKKRSFCCPNNLLQLPSPPSSNLKTLETSVGIQMHDRIFKVQTVGVLCGITLNKAWSALLP